MFNTINPLINEVDNQANVVEGGLPAENYGLGTLSSAIAPVVAPAAVDFTDYGNPKLTQKKQASALNYAQKYLGAPDLSQDQWSYISQNYTGSNLENTIKQLAEEQKINQLYQSTLGRAPTPEEFASATSQYSWKNVDTGLGSLLQNQANPTVATQTTTSQPGIDQALEQNLIKQTFRDLLGREATQQDLNYWGGAVDTNDINEIYKAIGAQSFGTEAPLPTPSLTDTTTSSVTQAPKTFDSDAINKYLQGEEDILNEYEYFRNNAIDPTLAGADYFANVGTNYADYATKTIDSILGAGASSFMGEEEKQNIVNNLLAGNITREDLTKTFSESAVNKQQEASRIAGIYMKAYGLTKDQGDALYASLMGQDDAATGLLDEATLTSAKNAFSSSLTSEDAANTEISNLIMQAANREGAQNYELFKENPELYYTYKDLGEVKKVGKSDPYIGGGYGLVNNLPVLADAEFQKIINQKGNNATYFAGSPLDDKLGWQLGGASSFIKTGAALAGVTKTDPVYDVITGALITSGGYDIDVKKDIQAIKNNPALTKEQKSAQIKEINNNKLRYVASKNGVDVSSIQNIYKDEPVLDEFGQQAYEYVKQNGKWVQKPVTQQVISKSIDDQIYDLLNEKFKDVAIVGGAKPGAKDKSKNFSQKPLEGISDEQKQFLGVDAPNENDFIAAMYKKVGDKWVAVPEDVFAPVQYKGVINPDAYKKKGVFGGGWLGDMAQGIAGIPGIAELAFVASGGNPAVYAAAKGAQTAAYSNSFKDIGKSAGLAYLSTAILPEIGVDLSGALAKQGITGAANKALTQAIMSGGVSAATGGSGTEGFTSGAISGGIGGGLDMIKPEFYNFATDLGVPDQFKGVFANTLASLAPTLITGGKVDPTKMLMSYVMRQALKGAKDTFSPTGTGAANNYIDQGSSDNRDIGIRP